jgi:hypothetical protein
MKKSLLIRWVALYEEKGGNTRSLARLAGPGRDVAWRGEAS